MVGLGDKDLLLVVRAEVEMVRCPPVALQAHLALHSKDMAEVTEALIMKQVVAVEVAQVRQVRMGPTRQGVMEEMVYQTP